MPALDVHVCRADGLGPPGMFIEPHGTKAYWQVDFSGAEDDHILVREGRSRTKLLQAGLET